MRFKESCPCSQNLWRLHVWPLHLKDFVISTYIYVWLCICALEYSDHGSQMKVSDPLEMESKEIVSFPIQGLGTEPWSSTRGTSALNQNISPVPLEDWWEDAEKGWPWIIQMGSSIASHGLSPHAEIWQWVESRRYKSQLEGVMQRWLSQHSASELSTRTWIWLPGTHVKS